MPCAFSFVSRTAILAVIVGHFFTLALAWCPSLHHWLHGDSDEPDHHCAVTALLDGQLDRPTLLLIVAMPPALQSESAFLLDVTPKPFVGICPHVHGRAPPLA